MKSITAATPVASTGASHRMWGAALETTHDRMNQNPTAAR
jgi:hypothetical protein